MSQTPPGTPVPFHLPAFDLPASELLSPDPMGAAPMEPELATSSLGRGLTRRAALGAGALGGLAALAGPLDAVAAGPLLAGSPSRPGWRMMAEQVTTPTLGKPAHPSSVGYRGALVTVASDPIPRTRLKDGRLVIHPTMLGNLLNAHMSSHLADRHPARIQFVSSVLDALMKRAPRRQGARFLAYEFDWTSGGATLRGPWFSSFGQSKFPLVAHRLYQATGNRRWLLYRNELVAAFRMPPLASSPRSPFVATVDANNCLWLEEYAHPGELHRVFNGHFFAMKDLADYVQVSGDPLGRELVQGAAATLDFYRNLCRVPGRFSNYYANHPALVPSYHWINTSCYLGLYDYTGATRLARTVDQMARDWRLTDTASVLRINPGVHQVCSYSNGRASKPTSWRTTKTLTIRSGTRIQWQGVAGTWLGMLDGPHRGKFLRQSPDLAFTTGLATDRVDFARTREVGLAANQKITGYSWSTDGVPRAVRSITLTRPAVVHSRTRAMLGGRHHILVLDGSLAGLWVREGGAVNFR